MSLEQIIVQVNPDSLPSGSDLTAVNAARKSFGKRSEWLNEEDLWCNPWVPSGSNSGDEIRYEMVNPYVKPELKPKDKRLIEFLARGMTADDFDGFLEAVSNSGAWNSGYLSVGGENVEELKELLWQWRNTPTHDTPFNHSFVSFEVKAPIFVARHLVKTEYTIMSEYSRRYITDDVEFYQHDYREASEDKKQGSGGVHKDNAHWQRQAQIANERQLELYDSMITKGIAPEQARGQLPLDLMTSWTWSGTLGAMAKMCRERLGSDAQKETRYVAEEVYKVLKEHYPVSAKCLVEGVL